MSGTADGSDRSFDRSFRRRILGRLPRRWRRPLQRIVFLPDDALRRLAAPDALRPPLGLLDVGAGDFETIGVRHLEHFRRLGGLRREHRVLDLGCGVGRMAIPLTRFLAPTASYLGLDVRAADVAWCRRRIGLRFPNFRFEALDVASSEYHPRGRIAASRVILPAERQSFDFVLATSLFTHLLEPATERYLGEVARVLAPGGVLFATFFLLPSRRDVEADPTVNLRFRHRLGNAAILDPERPEGAVAYDRDWLLARLARLDLRARVYDGWWAGGDGVDYQDIVVARASRPGPETRF